MVYLPTITEVFGVFGFLSGIVFLVYGLYLHLDGMQFLWTPAILLGSAGFLFIAGVYLTALDEDEGLD